MSNLDTLDKIMLLMSEKNYNQQILTDYLGVDKSIFSTWKNGKSKSYMKYLPQLASLFGVSIDWLVGSTRYRQEGLAEVYKWNISCVEGFDPVFDFGPLFKPYRENAGVSTEEMGKHIGLSEELYTIRENGEWPFLYADALKCCQRVNTTPKAVLESAGKLSDKPVTEPNTIVQPTESAADLYENSGENDTIYLGLNERLRLRQNFVYFAAEKQETLKVAMDNAGTSPQFLDGLNRNGNLLVKDIRLAAEYFGIDAELALKYDLTKQTGRNIAEWFKLREYDSAKLYELGAVEDFRRKLEQGYCPNERELECIAAAFGVSPIELPIPYEELREMSDLKVLLTDEDVSLMRNFYHLNDTGRERLMQYSRDMMVIYPKE